MRTLFYLSTLLALVISCTKPDDLNPPDPPNPTNTDLVSNTDSARFILLMTRHYPETYFTCYNPDKTIRWKRFHGNAVIGDPVYYNGTVYISSSQSVSSPNGSNKLVYDFYAIDPNSGTNIWRKQDSTNWINDFVIRGDTIFCAYNEPPNRRFVAAINSNDGNLLWKYQIPVQFELRKIKVDNSKLYFLSAESVSNTVINLYAFDLIDKMISWKTPLGYFFGGGSQVYDIVIDNSSVYIGSGALYSINKLTGSSNWINTDFAYHAPILKNGMLYVQGVSDIPKKTNIFAFNPATGSTKFQSSLDFYTTLNSQLFVSENFFYASGQTSNNEMTLASCNSQTGVTKWITTTNFQLSKPVVVGNKLYSVTFPAASTTDTLRLIVTTDCNNGNRIDSFVVAAQEIGKLSIVSWSGKFITPI